MTGGQFRACVAQLRCTQVSLAEDLCVTPLKVRKWSAGLDPVPEVVAVWLRALAKDAEDSRLRNPPPVVPRLPARRQNAARPVAPQGV
jgi:hypothetical protein